MITLCKRMDKPINNITHCVRCGTCCVKGGPVLHHEDKELLLDGRIRYEHLVTIRRGEPVYNPVCGRIEQASQEIVKVTGKGEDRSCLFYSEKDVSCAVYGHRFHECRLLKCWDTAEIMRIIGRDTIVRRDVINRGDPIMGMIEAHEKECPAYEVEDLITAASAGNGRRKIFLRLSEIIGKDISMRSYAVSELGLKAEYELFIFGRPVSKLLNDRGLAVLIPQEEAGVINILQGG